jgi:sucrose-phosphate synthase
MITSKKMMKKGNTGFNIVFINIHGLLRGSNLELGRDADTGGQTKYVLECARHCAMHPKVKSITILTRKIHDPRRNIAKDYNQEEEYFFEKKGRILRIECGGKKYLPKEDLWKHLTEFTENALQMMQKKDIVPDLLFSHYADAGEVAQILSKKLQIPFFHTAHSLGIPKKERLLAQNISEKTIEKHYHIANRVACENAIIESAECVITSTKDEIAHQYDKYPSHKNAHFVIIPPGLDTETFFPFYHEVSLNSSHPEEYDEILSARHCIESELKRFLTDPQKPLILAICRPEKRKNIDGLISAYGEDKELQLMANLAVFAGIRKDISKKNTLEKETLTEMLLAMDKYDLYGKLAIPKRHQFRREVPALYRHAARLKGVFVNSAFSEPFGLTTVEASLSGLPVIAPKRGGAREILEKCQNGSAVETTKPKEIASAIRILISDQEYWDQCSQNGIQNARKYFQWDNFVEQFLEEIEKRIKK